MKGIAFGRFDICQSLKKMEKICCDFFVVVKYVHWYLKEVCPAGTVANDFLNDQSFGDQ